MNTPPNPATPMTKPGRNLLRFVGRLSGLLLGIVFLVFILFNLLLRIPYLQQAAVSSLSRGLSVLAGTPASIQGVSLSGLTEFRMNKLYVEDPLGDTLLFVDQVYARLHPNLLKIFTEGLVIYQVRLVDGLLHSRELPTGEINSLQWFLKRFGKKGNNDSGNAFRVFPRLFILKHVTYWHEEPSKGIFQYVHLPKAKCQLLRAPSGEHALQLGGVSLVRPTVILRQAVTKRNNLAESPLLPRGFLSLESLKLTEGNLQIQDSARNMVLSQIDLSIADACYADGQSELRINQLSFAAGNNRKVRGITARQISFLGDRLVLDGISISLKQSEIRGDFGFTAPNLLQVKDWRDSLRLNIRLNPSQIFPSDLLAWIPELSQYPLWKTLEKERLTFSGRVYGDAARLSGTDLFLSLFDGSTFRGRVNFRDLGRPRREVINLRCKELYINGKTLAAATRLLRLDPVWERLGYLRYQGSLDGFFTDFVSFGKLSSGLGRANIDLKLDLSPGRTKARYAGTLAVADFDLGRFLSRPDFGKIAFTTSVAEGSGLTAAAASAILNANILEFAYRGYTYRNARWSGSLNARRLNGEFRIAEKNIDLAFEGEVDFTEKEIPKYNFAAELKNLDLAALGLSRQPWRIAGNAVLDMRNRRWSELEGLAVLSDVALTGDSSTFRLENLSLRARLDATSGSRQVEIVSDILDADLRGAFDLEKIPGALINYYLDAFPDFLRPLGLKRSPRVMAGLNLEFQVSVKKSGGLETFLFPGTALAEGASFRGEIRSTSDIAAFTIRIPALQSGKMQLEDLFLQHRLTGTSGRLDASVAGIRVGEQFALPPAVFLCDMNQREFRFQTRLGPDDKSAPALLELGGRIFPMEGDKIALKLSGRPIRILKDTWQVDSRNVAMFSEGRWDIAQMVLRGVGQELIIDDYQKKGLRISLSGLPLSQIDSLIKFTIKFSGRLQAELSFEDWKGFRNLRLRAGTDSLFLNRKDWGALRIAAERPSEGHPLTGRFSLINGSSALHLNASYNTLDLDTIRQKRKGYFDLQLNAYRFPNHFAGYFLAGILSDIQGNFDADLHFDGQFPALHTQGNIYLSKGGVTVDYLKTRYTYQPTIVPVNDAMFDLTGGILYDKYNHSARITGGVSHDHLRRFGFKARLESRRFLCLETRKGDNPNFYGQAMGTGEVNFGGTFRLPDIYVRASVADSTRVVVPITGEIVGQGLKNVRFVSRRSQTETTLNGPKKSALKGISFDMDLEAKAGAVLEMVFNEQTGDILRVTGRGGARLSVLRNEPLKIFGDITIDEGSYLFTYLAINKNFRLRPRGSISFDGDPYKARINVEATYEDISAAPSVLIQEYLLTASQAIRSEAGQNTRVTLILKLQGELFKPRIGFDLAFPNLQGSLASYVDGKLRVLRQDQNELNKQVFGLIVAGQFLPAVFSMSETAVVYNTVSEFVSNQLSQIVNQFISSIVGKGNPYSGTNFDIAFNRNPNFVITNLKAGNELQVSLRQSLLNNRLTVLVGGNLDNNYFGANTQATTFLGNDVVVEYDLSRDKSLKFRVYQKLQPDFAGSRLRFGAGISYRKEFESFADFLGSIGNN